MNLCNLLTEIINPSSLVYGAVSLTASIGTIIALAFTVHSVNESKKQTRLLSKKHTLDSIFDGMEQSLQRVIFYRLTAGGVETHFGKLAFYRTVADSPSYLFAKESNFEIIDQYITLLTVNLFVTRVIFERIEDDGIMNVYEKKMNAEIRFCNDYIKKSVAMMTDQYKKSPENYHKQLDKFKTIEESLDVLFKEANKQQYSYA